MGKVGQVERETQKHVIALLSEQLGYKYLGDWTDRPDNANIEAGELTRYLRERGYAENLIAKALDRLGKAAALSSGHNLYEANKDVYQLLRYGVKVKPGVGEQAETVWLIDWHQPANNHFAMAEEVTVKGHHTKRPDIVLYVNGIAVTTLELKRSKVAVSEGIRQTIGNQRQEFIRSFFSTVQLVLAGNEVEGLRYGVIDTPERYWMEWKEPSDVDAPLDRALLQMCAPQRLLELIHDFMVFDAGVKKTARHNQFFGVKAAQERIARREGGIIWHTQGSGKSLTMVWLAKWLRENQPQARVLLITDRIELDEQIEGVFTGVGEQIYRTTSGADLVGTLNTSAEWLICSLVHKFGATKAVNSKAATTKSANTKAERDAAGEAFIKEVTAAVPRDFQAKGNLFVFVDEAHRTQSGKLHDAMKQLLPGAVIIGFTGTPLLKADKKNTIKKFGSYIHTYKLNEAVSDEVVLDLRYEARHIDQYLRSKKGIDRWFAAKTKGATERTKTELKKRWGTIKKVTSAESRSGQIVADILLDMETKERLMDGRGNAILVTSGIYEACRMYELFRRADFAGKCAVITSYRPNPSDISKEDAGAGTTEKLHQYEIYRRMLAEHFNEPEDQAMGKVDQFEAEVKRRFITNPGQMRLLIVVDKLLTGFDAPPATYLYLDKKMRDHELFQAICRTNRLDGDKQYGYVVDYKDLFRSLQGAISDYTANPLDGYDPEDIDGLLPNRIESARGTLDNALERIRAICEPVAPPKETLQYQQYFCAKDPGDSEQLRANEPKRVALYKAVAGVTRAYANLANEMDQAGYSDDEAAKIRAEVAHYDNVRKEVQLGAGEAEDARKHDAEMRFMLDTYVHAEETERISPLDDMGLVDFVAQHGAGAVNALPAGIKNDPEAAAATIVNNVRKLIIEEYALNPKHYEEMSEVLDALIEAQRRGAISYREFMEQLAELAKNRRGGAASGYPSWADDGAKRALMDFFHHDEDLARRVDVAIRHDKPEGWVGQRMKERVVRKAIKKVLPADFDRFDELFDVVKARDEYH